MDSAIVGYCEVSQQLRERIVSGFIRLASHVNGGRIEKSGGDGKEGWFVENSLEGRVQPSSFEPAIRNHCYILDSEGGGLFRPSAYESVRRLLLQVPGRRRKLVEIDHGLEVKKGFSYLGTTTSLGQDLKAK